MPRNPDGMVLSHWHTLFENFSASTQDFYRAVEIAIAERGLSDVHLSRVRFSEGGIGSAEREYLRVQRKRITFDICSAPYGNGHFFSWWLAKVPPKYGLILAIGLLAVLLPVWMLFATVFLQVFKGTCASVLLFPLTLFLGVPAILILLGFLVERGILFDEETVLLIPYVGYLYSVLFNPTTYYRLDTAMMFRDSIRSAVNEVINGLREEKGLRLLGEDALRPDQEEEGAS